MYTFSSKNVVLSCFFLSQIFTKHKNIYIFSFATRFLLYRCLHYFIFPKQQSLRQCWRFAQVKFTLLCLYIYIHKHFYIYINSFTTTTRQVCIVCFYYYKSPSMFAKQTTTTTKKFDML